MSRKKIFGALFVVAVLVLAVLSSTVRSKVSLADERKYEELPQQENIYLSANKEQPQDAIEYQPMDSIELSSELELSPLGLPSDFSQEEIEIYKTVLQDFYDMQETIQFTCNITQTERIAEVLRRAYTSVECFWVSKLQWMHTETENGTVECSVIPQYSMSREERDHALLIINKHVNYIIQKSDGTPESIMHEAAEWLFAHAEYDHDEQTQLLKSRANLVGAFIDGKAVCAGYSRAAAYCLLRAGYSAAYCVGEAGGVCHAWNAYVDSTGRLVFADVTYAVTANDDLMVESFFDHSIYFQNSTDQDYDIDVWPTSCPWFSEIVANHSSITVQGLLKKERWNGTTAKDMEENFLYYVRSDIYGDVYSGLCLNNWLYGEEDRTFRRFSMAALQSTEDLMMAERLARSMCREIEKPIS